MRAHLIVLPILAQLVASAPAAAKLVPVLRREAPALARRHATLHVARPCRDAHPTRGAPAGERRRLLPGDVLRVKALDSRAGPPRLIVSTTDGAELVVGLACLSRQRPDYSYRGRGSFEAFHAGLLRDLPRLMEGYVALSRLHGHQIPVTDPETKQPHDDWQRAEAALDQLSWVRSELFKMAHSGRSERTVLRTEADWILPRGEAFIRGYAGGAPAETKARLKAIYLQLNKLSSLRTACGRVRRLQEQIDRVADDDKYRALDPSHRARLLSEDTARLHTEQAEWQTRLNTTVVEVRTALMGLGIKVR